MNITISDGDVERRRIGFRGILFVLALSIVMVWLVGDSVGMFGSGRLYYRGKSLEDWLRDLEYSSPVAVQQQAMEAIKQVGSNSVPTLLSWITAQDSRCRLRANYLLSRQRFIHWKYALAAEKATSASRAFQALGSQGASAIPKLTELFNDSKYRGYAAGALAGIGEPAIDAVTPFLTTSNPQIREEAVQVLVAIKSRPKVVVPALSAQLPESSSAIRGLGEYGIAATSHVATLRDLLYGDPRYAFDAASSLAGLGEEGLIALVEATGNSNLTTRRVAAAGLGWYRQRNSTILPQPAQGPESPLTSLIK